MNGVHDMGGMHGFGPVDTTDEDSLHADWEWIIFAIDRILKIEGEYNIDEKRHAIERLDPAAYLGSTYFERWARAIENLVVEKELLTESAIESRVRDLQADEHAFDQVDQEQTDGELAQRVHDSLRTTGSFRRADSPPAFTEGQHVRVKNRHPSEHTRAPRYARRSTGVIETHHGTFVLPDTNAHGEETAEPLYTVRFTARELWGDEYAETDSVCIDLWERYLQPASNDH